MDEVAAAGHKESRSKSRSNRRGSDMALSPGHLLSVLGLDPRWEQEDAHEFLLNLIQQVSGRELSVCLSCMRRSLLLRHCE